MPAVRTAARYVFSISVFTLILYLLDASDVLATIAGADIVSVVIAVGFALAAQFSSAVRLRRLLLMQGITLSLRKVFSIGLSAVFFGLVIPGGTLAAFATRFVKLARNARVELVGAALVVDRVIATAFLVILGSMAIALDRAEPTWISVIVVCAITGAAIIALGRRAPSWITGRLGDAAGNESLGRLHRFGARIGRAFLNYSSASGRQVLIILATSLLSHLCGYAAYYVIAIAIGLDISFLSICWIRSGLILSTMIPVSVAGLGAREITAIALLIPLGFSEAQAVGFSMLIFLVTAVIIGLIGGFFELLGAIGRR